MGGEKHQSVASRRRPHLGLHRKHGVRPDRELNPPPIYVTYVYTLADGSKPPTLTLSDHTSPPHRALAFWLFLQ